MKVVIVGVDFYKDNHFDYYMQELSNLCQAVGFEVVDQVTQKLERINNKHYLGSGKIEDLSAVVASHEADLIVINNELTGMQNKTIEDICECKVFDRTQLILEIFAVRAKTKEARLQVAIAQLKYQKTRQIGSYDNLSRQGGGKVGTVNRGGGEKKLDLDRRIIEKQISEMQKELEKFVKTRTIQRQKRSNNQLPIVSITGYTNAGKSTLMNSLVNVKKAVYEEDMLFATLDTSVRKIKLESGLAFLLVDTVGFVSQLPHELVKAFRSTLEEITTSDLIIHLTDLSNPDFQIHKDVVNKTLKLLEVDHIQRLVVNNKCDLVYQVNPDEINISAKSNLGIDNLLNQVSDIIFKDYETVNLKLSYNQLGLVSSLKENTYCEILDYQQDYVVVKATLSQVELNLYKDLRLK